MQVLNFIKNLIIIVVCLGITVVLFGFVKKGFLSKGGDVVEDNTTSEIEFLSDNGVSLFLDREGVTGVVKSPLYLKGRAPGYWFFEASAPVVVTNWDGLIIGESYITAVGEWTTEDYVSFEGVISFANTEYGDYGFLILQKDNPSGDSQFDDAVEIRLNLK